MRKNIKNFTFIFVLLLATAFLAINPKPEGIVRAQQPTGSIPTVTGTPRGAFITVTYPEQINVRSGPSSTIYPNAIGVLLPGETAPAIGRSTGGEWIQIVYMGVPNNVGWVYTQLVSLSPNSNLLPVDAPPTPTPLTTATYDPTLAAEFIPQYTPTRLPTFTPAVPLEPVTYQEDSFSVPFPIGVIIAGFALAGLFAALVSFLRGR